MSSVSSISPEKPVLILIHGATGNGRMWDPLRRILEPRYRILSPDLPGHGSRQAETFTLEGGVATVVEAARSVSPAPVVVGGDSLGGYVSTAAADALTPSQLKGLVLSGCTMNFRGPALVPFYFKIFFNKLLLATLGEKRLLGERFVSAAGKLGLEPRDARAVLEGGLNMRAFPDCVAALTGVDFVAKVARIRKPMLFLNGSKDRDMMRQQADFQAAAPQARFHVFDGAGHGVSLLRSAEFAALVDEFASQPV
jgi:pimeloyl-ACP methyl ester carboxylesterase